MSKTYADRVDSKIYGTRLIIYRRREHQNRFFWFRAKIAGRAGYIRRSSGTQDAAKAIFIAEAAYEDLLIRHKGGLSLTETTFDKFFYDWTVRKQHNFTETRRRWKIGVFERYLKGYFGQKKLSDLTKRYADGYWIYRSNFWATDEGQQRIAFNQLRIGARSRSSHNVAEKASFATLRAEASLINEILGAAVDEGQLARIIKVSAQDAVAKNERGDGYRHTFTDDEWRVLTVCLDNYAFCRGQYKNDRTHSRHKFQRLMLRVFVLFASSTGMRVGEIRQLRWGDLEIRHDNDGNRILISRVRGETSKVRRSRSVVAHNSHIVTVLEEFKRVSKHVKDNDLVFYSDAGRGVSTVDMSTNFKTFLKRCEYEGRKDGLRYSHDGKARTFYSLRHFYAVQRLKQNVDVYQLATNMGTSVNQIRNHYGRHISGDAFVKELTKSATNSDCNARTVAVRKLIDMVESGSVDVETALSALKRFASREV